jgi:DNA uptake protein ComE-like DNA-binding protein
MIAGSVLRIGSRTFVPALVENFVEKGQSDIGLVGTIGLHEARCDRNAAFMRQNCGGIVWTRVFLGLLGLPHKCGVPVALMQSSSNPSNVGLGAAASNRIDYVIARLPCAPRPHPRAHPFSVSGSVLVGLLWCLALLSLIVIGVLHTSRMDLLVVKNYGDRIQAHYLALAGIEKAKALLYHDAKQRSRSGTNHGGELYDDAGQFRDVELGRGVFRVIRRGRTDEGGGILYGVSDEESRLNVNAASLEELSKLDGMTPDVAAAIIDWIDADNVVTPGGAEAEYYTSLQPPYLPRNGPLQTIRELLMVRGISRELLFGQDRHQNGMLEPTAGESEDTSAGEVDTGWAGLMTVDSTVNDANAAGDDRVNVQTADETTLTGIHGITADIAKAITSYRGQNRFNSIADLLDVTAAQNQNQPGRDNQANLQAGQNQNGPGQNNAGASGPKVISENLLMDIADDVTVSGRDLQGPVNINTASLEVLMCLPGLTRQTAQALISHRQSSGFFLNIAWLLKVPGITQDIFKQLAPRVTARSETFRILSEGKVTSTGARQRIQAIVHVGLRDTTILSYREDDL